jgi:regulator of protease activity HflC (stomatin/prohibitin superfamily)
MGTIEVPGGDIRNILNKAEILPFIQVQIVESYQKGLLFVDGKFEKEMESGVYFFWKGLTPITILKADLRQQLMEVSGQEILTKDKASVRLNVQTVYKITDVRQALIENKDAEKQLYTLVQLALREEVGKMTIDELLAAKESLSEKMLEIIVEKAKNLGITVLDCGIRDIILPGEIREIMNQVLVAQKKAEANMITRREETASTRSMLNTAKLMEDNAMLWRIKEMEFIEKVTEKINNISLGSDGSIVKQLKEIFTTAR